MKLLCKKSFSFGSDEILKGKIYNLEFEQKRNIYTRDGYYLINKKIFILKEEVFNFFYTELEYALVIRKQKLIKINDSKKN